MLSKIFLSADNPTILKCFTNRLNVQDWFQANVTNLLQYIIWPTAKINVGKEI